MKVLVTGSSGLIGSEAVEYYDRQGHTVVGIDNHMRGGSSGPAADTTGNLERLKNSTRTFTHGDVDIRNRPGIFDLFREHRFDLVIHCAAEPCRDRAAQIPLLAFEVNAVGTINLLEAARQFTPEAVFIHMSTNKVYGDAPNELPLVELETRYDYARPEDYQGIREECRIDRSLHSLFGTSKAAADLVAQQYGRYYGLNVGIFRRGCRTGPAQPGFEVPGFLHDLVKAAVAGQAYRVSGYKGKQVQDIIHSHDVVQAFEAFRGNPRPGEVYNLGGGRENSLSVLEALYRVGDLLGKPVPWAYEEQHRIGDHICYISDLGKLRGHYPGWQITRSLDSILGELVQAEALRG